MARGCLAVLLFFAAVHVSFGEEAGLRVSRDGGLIPDSFAGRLLVLDNEHDPNSCGAELQRKFNCTEYDCLDRVAGACCN